MESDFNKKLGQANTFELLEALSKKPKSDIEFALFQILIDGKLNYVNLSNAYTAYLEHTKNDYIDQLIEAECCVTTHVIDFERNVLPELKEPLDDWRKNMIQRSLYLLNKSKRINTESLNKLFEYDEEYAKKLSWYEENKQGKF